MMGRSGFLRFLLVLALLALSFSYGLGRIILETVEVGDSMVQAEEIVGISREMSEVLMDYQLNPEPNINPKTGTIPPPQG